MISWEGRPLLCCAGTLRSGWGQMQRLRQGTEYWAFFPVVVVLTGVSELQFRIAHIPWVLFLEWRVTE